MAAYLRVFQDGGEQLVGRRVGGLKRLFPHAGLSVDAQTQFHLWGNESKK
jgi:hypothetical protein